MRTVKHRRTTPPAPDAGFTLVETIVSIGIIGVVMAGLGTFFVSSMRTTNNQTGTQAAVQVAGDAMERVRSLTPSLLTKGRGQAASTAQWNSPVTGVAPWLAGMQMAFDSGAAAGDGASAAVPTSPLTVTLAGVPFKQNYYIGRCWQPAVTGGDCTQAKPANAVEFWRVVIGVTWPDNGCKTGTCSYVTTTLISNAEREPRFDTNDQATPPVIVPPGDQTDDIDSTVSFQLVANGGTAPLNWTTAQGLPTTMSMNTSGLITGRTPATPGSHSITVTVQDDYDLTNTATFTWIVNARPTMNAPAAQRSMEGKAITAVQLSASGGTGPFTWSATGLPPGVSLNTGTGQITGTPTDDGPYRVTGTVRSKNGNTSSASWDWNVRPALTITNFAITAGQRSTNRNTTVDLQLAASGGSGTGYRWSATNLPSWLTLTSAGKLSGKAPNAASTTSNIKITVTDSESWTTETVTFSWRVP